MTAATSLVALIVSVVAVAFAILSWRESNRPLVTVRVGPKTTGNIATLPDLIVENTGTRPAKNVRLWIDPVALHSAFSSTVSASLRADIAACFEARWAIPVLANGHKQTNQFGVLSGNNDNTWNWPVTLSVVMRYQDIRGRPFQDTMDLLIAPNLGFAQSAFID